jgi:hypothetical protein
MVTRDLGSAAGSVARSVDDNRLFLRRSTRLLLVREHMDACPGIRREGAVQEKTALNERSA